MPAVPAAVADWFEGAGWGPVAAARPVSGGCIHNGQRLTTGSGRTAFLKSGPQAPPDMFAREAEGLAALSAAGGLRVPAVYLVGVDFLLLEDLAPAAPAAGYWEAFGRGLAALHSAGSDQFGFDHDNYLGSTPQPNPKTADGFAFFAEARLGFQARLARQNGLIDAAFQRRIERFAARLQEWVPAQPPALIHGDLWRGNMLSDSTGSPAVIDPAAHFGWPEADLAMTALFGAPPEAFYRAYQEASPLPPGLRERFPVYNLYHLLNHLNLFGRVYFSEVDEILDRFLR